MIQRQKLPQNENAQFLINKSIKEQKKTVNDSLSIVFDFKKGINVMIDTR